MAENLVIIGRKDGDVVYVCTIDPNVKYDEVEKMVENDFKPINPEISFEIICDKLLYEISKYFIFNEYNEYNKRNNDWKALYKDLGVIETSIKTIRDIIGNGIKTE